VRSKRVIAALGVDSVEHDDIDAGGNEAVHLRDLLVKVIVGRDGCHLDVRVDFLRTVFDALDRGDEERVAK
jgi:hypothetical protein